MPHRFSPYQVYLVFSGVSAFSFTLFGLLSSVYRFETAGLGPLQLILVGTVLELSVFLFEVPTGVVADVYGRRRSVITGTLLIGLGFALEGALPFFVTVLLAQAVWGIGSTFESGALEAWVADEIGEQRVGEAFLRGAQVAQVSAFVAVPVGTALGSVYLGFPMRMAGGVYFLLALFLVLYMRERAFTPEPGAARRPIKTMHGTLNRGLKVARRTPFILTIFLISAILGASSETFDRLWEAHFLANVGFPEPFTPVVWFGLINAVLMLVTLAVTESLRRRVDTNAHVAVARALLVINLFLTLSVVLFGLAGNFWLALTFYGASVVLRTTHRPLYRAWLNQRLERKTRATVFSLNAQMDALGQIAGGPLLGLAAALYGMPWALVLSGLLLLPASYLYVSTLRRATLSEEKPVG